MNIPADISSSLEAIMLMKHSMSMWAITLLAVAIPLFIVALIVSSAEGARIYGVIVAVIALGIFYFALSIEFSSRDATIQGMRPHCTRVLSAISDGRLRYLEPRAVLKVEEVCGTEEVRDAANAPTSRFLSRTER